MTRPAQNFMKNCNDSEPQASDGPMPHSRSALLVEDEPALREALAELLAVEYEVVAAVASLVEARDVLRETPVDVIVLDWRLKGETGSDLLRELADQPVAPAVVLVSASPIAPVVAEAFGIPCVPKPFDNHVLLSIIASSLASRPRRTTPAPVPA